MIDEVHLKLDGKIISFTIFLKQSNIYSLLHQYNIFQSHNCYITLLFKVYRSEHNDLEIENFSTNTHHCSLSTTTITTYRARKKDSLSLTMASTFDSVGADVEDSTNNIQNDQMSSNSRPFDYDGYMGYDSSFPAPTSQDDAFSGHPLPSISDDLNVDPPTSVTSTVDLTNNNHLHSQEMHEFGMPEANQFTSPFETMATPETNGNLKGYGEDDCDIFASRGPVLPDPTQMQEEGFQRREWRR